jgi:hypothetical protein
MPFVLYDGPRIFDDLKLERPCSNALVRRRAAPQTIWREAPSSLEVPSMCDYSLHLVVSRPAKVGDKLVSTRFPETITRGFASVDDRNVAVCLLPGTELAFEEEVACETRFVFSSRHQIGQTVAKFQQVNKGKSNSHHDALEFPDGKIVLLTHLCEGQHVTVLQLPAHSRVKVDDAQRHDSLVVYPR